MPNSTTAVLREEERPGIDGREHVVRNGVSNGSFQHSSGSSDRWTESQIDDESDNDQVFVETSSIDKLHNHNTRYEANINGSLKELSTLYTATPRIEQTQKTTAENNAINSKGPIVKKPRPNSLAILSRSHDLIHIVGDEEVGARGAATPNTFNSHQSSLCSKNRAASADTLLQKPTGVGLQQRRNQRPTSLLIPSLLDLRPEISQTANAYGDSSLKR